MEGIVVQWCNVIFIEFKEGRGSISSFQGSPMLSLPRVIIVNFHITKTLFSLSVSNMFYGNIEHVLSKIRADIAPIAIGLFLKIVHYFPTNVILDNSGKIGDIGKITWMKQKNHGSYD